jgi:osmotically-inducible protein OsmY
MLPTVFANRWINWASKDVSVSRDPYKGIVALGGQVAINNEKSQAEPLAKSFAGAKVAADQIAVIPWVGEKEA